MAIDETTLYTVINTEITRSSIVQEMINYYNLLHEVGDTRVTDFNEGSEIRNLLESDAVAIYELLEDQNNLTSIGFIETAEGEWLDKHGEDPRLNLPRLEGTFSTGYVEFSIPTASDTLIEIPSDTVLTCTENDMDYSTDSDATINIGDTSSGLISATCLIDGYDGNCDKDTITVISDETINIAGLTVNNPSSFDGGVDYEEDDEYRERLLNYERRDDFGSLPYYEDLARDVTGVHDVLLVDDASYTSKILVNSNTKPTPVSVLADVLDTFSYPSNIVFGHTFTVDTPDYLHVWLKVALTVDEEVDVDDVEATLQALYDGGGPLPGYELDGLSIGQGLTRDSIDSTLDVFEDILSSTVQVKYSDDGETWDSEWSDYVDKEVDTDTVLKLDKVDVTQTIAE